MIATQADHTGKRVLGRIRLSREAEDTGTSEDRQREAVETWARMHGAVVTGWAVDLGVSGGVDPFKAPELGAWLKPERLPEWDILVGYRLDRISRRLLPLHRLIEFADNHGKTIASVSENIDMSHWVGKLVVSVLGAIAEGELEAATQRNLGSQESVRKLGRLHSGVVPYGYQRVKIPAGAPVWGDLKAETAGWYAVIDPEESKILRDYMVPDTLANKSTNSIAERLNKDEVPTKFGARSRSGKAHTGKWDATVVRRILQSPTLMGYAVHKNDIVTDDDGIPVQRSEPLITREEFDQVQAKLNQRSIRQSPRDQSTNLLAGVAFCWHCKGPLYRAINKQRGITYYRCPNALNGGTCEHLSLRDAQLTELVESEFLDKCGGVERTAKVFVPAADHTENLSQAKLALKTARKENELGLYEGEPDEYLGRVQRLKKRIKTLEQLPAQPARFEYRGLGETYGQAWKRMNTDERRQLLSDSGIRVEATRVGGKGSKAIMFLLDVPVDITLRIQNDGVSTPLTVEDVERLKSKRVDLTSYDRETDSFTRTVAGGWDFVTNDDGVETWSKNDEA